MQTFLANHLYDENKAGKQSNVFIEPFFQILFAI